MLNNKVKIEVLSAPCGSGKTYQICQEISNHTDEKYLIAVPTKILAKEYKKLLNKTCIPFIDRVDSGDYCQNKQVSKTIETTIKAHNLNEDGGVVTITQQALVTGKFHHLINNWTLIIDEIPSIDSLKEHQIPYHYDLLTQYIDIDESFVHPKLYKLKVVNKNILKMNSDDILKMFKPLVEDITGFFDAYVEIKCWDKNVIRREITADVDVNTTYGNEYNTLSIVSMLSPRFMENFKRIIIAGANFETSVAFKWWSSLNIDCVMNKLLMNKLLYQKHTNGNRLKIIWLMERDFSKTQRNKLDNEFGTIGKKLFDMAIKIVVDDFLYILNSDFGVEIDVIGTRTPVISHGLNSYDKFNKMYFGCALNKNPAHNRVLNGLDLGNDFLKIANLVEIAYQNLMRTSMRVMADKQDVVMVVNDKFTAEALAERFEGCTVEAHPEAIMNNQPISQPEYDSRVKAGKLLNEGVVGNAMDVKNYLAKLNTNNVVKINEDIEYTIKNVQLIDHKIVNVNFAGSFTDLKNIALKNKLSLVAYTSANYVGQTATVFVKNGCEASRINKLFEDGGLMVYGNDFIIPCHLIGNEASNLVEFNVRRDAKIKFYG